MRGAPIHSAFRLEAATIVWMTIEATVAIGAAIVADSPLLIAFGVDSGIELAAAGVLVWWNSNSVKFSLSLFEPLHHIAARTRFQMGPTGIPNCASPVR